MAAESIGQNDSGRPCAHCSAVLVEHIKAGRTTDMADAPMANSARVYADPLRYEAERRKLFLEMPLVAGLSGDIPNTGDTLVFDGAGRPIIVVRDAAGRANAFLNMCRHRGARLVNENGCHARFTCPFHSWSFDLNGRLAGQPGKLAVRGSSTPASSGAWCKCPAPGVARADFRQGAAGAAG